MTHMRPKRLVAWKALALTIFMLTLILLFLTPVARMLGFPFFDMVIKQYGLVVYIGLFISAVFVVMLGLAAVAPVAGARKRIAFGYHKAFLELPWSFIGVTAIVAGFLGFTTAVSTVGSPATDGGAGGVNLTLIAAAVAGLSVFAVVGLILFRGKLKRALRGR